MLNHPKSMLYSLIITAFLFVMLTACDFKNHGKIDAVIEIDLTQQGKTLSPDMYGDFIKGATTEKRIQRKTTITGVKPGTGNLHTALTKAVIMIEMERNSAAIRMSFENDRAYKSSSYYAIKLFAENKPDKVMPTKVTPESVYATAGIQEKAGFVIIKLVNLSNAPKVCKIILKYKQQIKNIGEAYVMTSESILDENSLKDPEKIVPMTKELKGLKNTFNYECPANSIVIIKLRYKKRIIGNGNCC